MIEDGYLRKLLKEQQALLILLRKSMWGTDNTLPVGVDWNLVSTYAKEQGVLSLLYDGVTAAKVHVPDALLQNWRRSMLQGVMRNERLLKAQDEVVDWFSQAGIPCVILKGSSISRYYSQPDLRILGDTDILVDKDNISHAKEILLQHGYTFHEADHAFHMGFHRAGAYVELHYHVTKLPDSAGGRAAQLIIDNFLLDIEMASVGRYVFPVLSQTNQAMSLLLHMIRHMFESGIGLRQICDWAMYMKSADMEHFINDTIPIIERCGLRKYAEVVTKTCIEYLGVPSVNMDWCRDVTDDECHIFLMNVFQGGNMGSANQDSMGSLFVDKDSMGNKQRSVCAFFSQLSKLVYKNFPVSRKCTLLLPLFWIYLPLRYFFRMITGQRPWKSLRKVFAAAEKQHDLYSIVKVFDVEN